MFWSVSLPQFFQILKECINSLVFFYLFYFNLFYYFILEEVAPSETSLLGLLILAALQGYSTAFMGRLRDKWLQPSPFCHVSLKAAPVSPPSPARSVHALLVSQEPAGSGLHIQLPSLKSSPTPPPPPREMTPPCPQPPAASWCNPSTSRVAVEQLEDWSLGERAEGLTDSKMFSRLSSSQCLPEPWSSDVPAASRSSFPPSENHSRIS